MICRWFKNKLSSYRFAYLRWRYDRSLNYVCEHNPNYRALREFLERPEHKTITHAVQRAFNGLELKFGWKQNLKKVESIRESIISDNPLLAAIKRSPSPNQIDGGKLIKDQIK